VQLDGFGSFDRTERAARPGRDPRSGDPIEIPARRAARFRPARALKDALQG
jgi:DNA-binding protein HU-beta